MALSMIVYPGDGITTQFNIPFALGYIKEDDITVRVGSEVDGTGAPMYRDLTFLSPEVVEVSGDPASVGENLVFTRTVDRSGLIVDYEDGDIINESNMNTAQKQAIMLVHEVMDGRFAEQLQLPLDMGGNRIINMANPTDPADAATKDYVDTILAGTAPDPRVPVFDSVLSASTSTIPAARRKIILTSYLGRDVNMTLTDTATGELVLTSGGSTARGWYRAIPDTVTPITHYGSSAARINRAIEDISNDPERGPLILSAKDTPYIIDEPIVLRSGVHIKGVPGNTNLRLADGANCNVIETAGFDTWAAWTSGDLTGYPMEMSIDGLYIDGNASNQQVPDDADSLLYGLKALSHRMGIGWLQVRNVNGIGVRTAYNSAIMLALRQAENVGRFGAREGTPSPYVLDRINVSDCLYEACVLGGPADVSVNHLTTNFNGWLEQGTVPDTPRTSLLFPGEEIHSVRLQTAFDVKYINANAAIYGRSVYVAPFVRVTADKIITSSSWGAVKIDSSAYGVISELVLQSNAWAHGGVHKPYLECVTGTSSGGGRGRFSFPHVLLRRVNNVPAANNAPGIVDDAGHQFGIIDHITGANEAGHCLVIGANNRGGIYESVNFENVVGTAHDATESAAVLVNDGARDWVIDNIRLVNCGRAFVNNGVNMRGTVRSGTIEVNVGSVTGQIALEGVVSSSQVAGVIPGTGTIAVENLPDWRVEIIYGGSRYYNHFNISVVFDMSSTGAKALTAVNHNMWRTPSARDITTSIVFGGTTWPAFNAGIRTITSSSLTPAGFVHTAQPGNVTMSIKVG